MSSDGSHVARTLLGLQLLEPFIRDWCRRLRFPQPLILSSFLISLISFIKSYIVVRFHLFLFRIFFSFISISIKSFTCLSCTCCLGYRSFYVCGCDYPRLSIVIGSFCAVAIAVAVMSGPMLSSRKLQAIKSIGK